MDLFKKASNDLLVIIKEYLGDVYASGNLAQNVRFVVPPVQTGADFSTNVAMVFAKSLGKNPRDIALELAERFKAVEYIKEVNVAGAYINIVFTEQIWEQFLSGIVKEQSNFGNGDKKEKVLLEFISANPTGPLHVGHCRGAILGLALGNLLKKAGYGVTKEYYMNDYGVQINTLLKSIQFRYEQQFGKHKGEDMPEGCYPGSYLTDYAKSLAKEYGDKFVGINEGEFYASFKQKAIDAMMGIITSDLKLLGLEYDSFVSETDLIKQGKIGEAINVLKGKSAVVVGEDGQMQTLPYIYEGMLEAPKGGSANEDEQEESRFSDKLQTLFRSTLFGDDRDRVVLRADGTGTYFASDIAYHKYKYDRGYNAMINIFGADHGGYVKRITSAVDAVSDHNAKLEVVLCQMVALEKDGVPFKMSKRKGTFVLLSDVAKEINVDELKLFMLSKSADTPMVFDLVKIKEKSKDNLVYYIQYAYARTNSVLKNFENKFGYEYTFNEDDLKGFFADAPSLVKEICVLMAKYPSVILSASQKRAPNMIVDFLKEIASMFHSIWGTNIKLVCPEDEKHSRSMMAFVTCVKMVIKNALECIAVNAPEHM